MPDIVAELRQAITAAVMQEVQRQAARQDWGGRSAVLAPSNPMGAAPDAATGVTFATGFDGTNTVLPFQFDQSALDGTDTLL